MNEITIDTWEEFEELLLVFDQYRENLDEKTDLYVSNYLYRGQANHEWGLETTLERFTSKKDLSFSKYYRFALAAQPRIETFTGENWPLVPPSDFNKWLAKQDPLMLTDFMQYEYFAYLRHHGFPSPFLDWSMSPYVALFFALQNSKEDYKYSSVYIYLEYTGGAKLAGGDEPFIHVLGPYAKIHKRHYLQQSCYTICSTKTDNDFVFHEHDHFYKHQKYNQDRIYKINIPITEKNIFLNKLNKMNINAFSLIGSIESLMESTSIIEQTRL